MKPTTTTTVALRIGAALSLPITLAAATVALAGYLFLSDLRPASLPRGSAQVIVIDDLPAAQAEMLASGHRG